MVNKLKQEYELILKPYLDKSNNKERSPKETKLFKCDICGHSWGKRGKTKPKICPNCKNPNWNILKVLYETLKYTSKKLSIEQIKEIKKKYGYKVFKEIEQYQNPYSKLAILKEVLDLNKKDLERFREQIKDYESVYIPSTEKEIKEVELEIEQIEKDLAAVKQK